MINDFPPAGTTCQDCKLRPAAVYSGNVPVCWECDAMPTGHLSAISRQLSAEKPDAPPGAAHTPSATPPLSPAARVERIADKLDRTARKASLKAASATGKRAARLAYIDNLSAEVAESLNSSVLNPLVHSELSTSLRARYDHDEPDDQASSIEKPSAPPGAAHTPSAAHRAPGDRSTVAGVTAQVPAEESKAESPTQKPGEYPAPAIDHFTLVIADLESLRADLQADLEAIDRCLPILRTIHTQRQPTIHLEKSHG